MPRLIATRSGVSASCSRGLAGHAGSGLEPSVLAAAGIGGAGAAIGGAGSTPLTKLALVGLLAGGGVAAERMLADDPGGGSGHADGCAGARRRRWAGERSERATPAGAGQAPAAAERLRARTRGAGQEERRRSTCGPGPTAARLRRRPLRRPRARRKLGNQKKASREGKSQLGRLAAAWRRGAAWSRRRPARPRSSADARPVARPRSRCPARSRSWRRPPPRSPKRPEPTGPPAEHPGGKQKPTQVVAPTARPVTARRRCPAAGLDTEAVGHRRRVLEPPLQPLVAECRRRRRATRQLVAEGREHCSIPGGLTRQNSRAGWSVAFVKLCGAELGCDRLAGMGRDLLATEGQRDLALEDVKLLLEVVAMGRRPAVGRDQHVDHRVPVAGLLFGDEDGVGVADNSEVCRSGSSGPTTVSCRSGPSALSVRQGIWSRRNSKCTKASTTVRRSLDRDRKARPGEDCCPASTPRPRPRRTGKVRAEILAAPRPAARPGHGRVHHRACRRPRWRQQDDDLQAVAVEGRPALEGYASTVDAALAVPDPRHRGLPHHRGCPPMSDLLRDTLVGRVTAEPLGVAQSDLAHRAALSQLLGRAALSEWRGETAQQRGQSPRGRPRDHPPALGRLVKTARAPATSPDDLCRCNRQDARTGSRHRPALARRGVGRLVSRVAVTG